MGAISESFAQLSDLLIAEHRQRPDAVSPTGNSEAVIHRLIRPLLPAAIRVGPGSVVDIRDRQVGPFDVVAGLDTFPLFGDGASGVYPIDGVVFCLQARAWEANSLSDFGAQAKAIRQLERSAESPVFFGAIAYGALTLTEIREFLQGSEGQAIDAVVTLGHHLIVRNAQGWYGPQESIPFVTESDPATALKNFSFLLAHICQRRLGQPFGLGAYQHL